MQLVVGRILKAHGIRGEVAVDVRTDDPERRFAVGSRIDTDPPERGPLTVTRVRWQSGRPLIAFDGVPDRTAAEALAGTMLVADSSTAPPSDDPDEFWDHELVGLRAELSDGTAVGVVEEVLHLPGHDTFVVRREDATDVLVPFVADIVPEVDVAGGRVVLTPPPGLLDADAAEV